MFGGKFRKLSEVSCPSFQGSCNGHVSQMFPGEAGRLCHRRSEERSQNRPRPCDPPPPGPWPFGRDISLAMDTAHNAPSLLVGDLAAGWPQSWGAQARFCFLRT